ncbi:TolC family protein [Phocaeicola sp.]
MKKITIILYSLFCSLPLLAQETLSLKECREMALKYNKEIAASVKQTESARYTAKSYKGNFFPNFTASGTGLYSNADGSYGIAGGNLPTFLPDATGQPVPNGGFAYFPGINLDYKIGWVYMGGVQVEQPLYMGGKILSAYRMSVLGKEMAQMNETLTATEVILKTDQAYALVVKAKEMKTVADKYNAVLAELKKNVESAHKHGLKPQNDVLKVQVKLNESELSIRKAENALRLATMNLCHLIGKPLTSDIRVSGDFPEIEQDLEIQVLDITARPEYGILDKQVAIAKQQVKLNRSELLPKIGVRGSYDYVHGLEINKENLLDKGSFSVLLNVSVPLFHFGERSNKVRAAKAKLEQTRLQQQNMNEQMLLELTQAANNLDEAKLESELSNRSLQQAEENMRVSKSQYEVGLETLSDHLEAQALWQQAYETKVDAHFQLYLNYVEYLKATGTLYERE